MEIKRPTRRELLLAALLGPASINALKAEEFYEKPSLTMFVERGYLPISDLDSKRQCVGMIGAALTQINAVLGWKIDYVTLPWKRALEYAARGKIDAYCALVTDDRRAYMNFSSRPLFTIDQAWAHFSPDNPRADEIRRISTLDDLKKFRIGLVRSDSWPNSLVTDEWHTTEVEDNFLLEGMARASRIDLLLEAKEVMNYHYHSSGRVPLEAVHVGFLPGRLADYHFGIRRTFLKSDALLRQFDEAHKKLSEAGAIDKALASFRS